MYHSKLEISIFVWLSDRLNRQTLFLAFLRERDLTMAYFLLLCQIVLAVVLLVAATGKLTDSEQLAAALRLSRIPSTLVSFDVSLPKQELPVILFSLSVEADGKENVF